MGEFILLKWKIFSHKIKFEKKECYYVIPKQKKSNFDTHIESECVHKYQRVGCMWEGISENEQNKVNKAKTCKQAIDKKRSKPWHAQ